MHKELLNWINENRERLTQLGINTDEVFCTNETVEEPCVRIDQSTEQSIGRICVWKNGVIDIEVLNIQSEKRLMIAHYEEQNKIDCFVQPYIEVMLGKDI